ncbi:MAG: LacI family DNA-binding transcriptional regulator [Sphingomonadales bacterium]|nr:LacI family DNA-binding transcriptional regulator [Sphingomonadales bacterium]
MNFVQTAPPGHATMADVAELAGVSLKSVSRVINNEPHVSPRLRDKVEAAISALNYVPDTAARSLAGARSFTIGVLFDNPSPNYTMKVQSGVYRACVEHQHHLRIDNLDSLAGTAGLESQLAALLRNGRTDGFVLTPPLSDNPQVLDFLERHRVRYSRIAPVLDPGRSPAVLIDDEAAAAQIAQMFWDRGHRRFGLINGQPSHGAAITRRRGFIGRLRALDPDAIVNETEGGFTFEGGIAAGRDLMSARRYPTAIFAANDDSAAGAIVACFQLGYNVPRDVSICGFDDSWVAKSVWPYLTTVHQPIEDMAHAAAVQLLDRALAVDTNPQVSLRFALIERDSVADAP